MHMCCEEKWGRHFTPFVASSSTNLIIALYKSWVQFKLGKCEYAANQSDEFKTLCL